MTRGIFKLFLGFIVSFVLLIIMTLILFWNVVLVKPHAGLGNQMFQYAAAYSVAKETGRSCYVLISQKSKKLKNISSTDRNIGLLEFGIPKDNIIYLGPFVSNLYNFLKKSGLFTKNISEENFFQVISSPPSKFKPIIIDGYFESNIFFKNVENDIKNFFDISNLKSEKLSNKLSSLKEDNSVCVHVRRGDMKTSSRYLPVSYYKQAMEIASKILKTPKFYIFSDEYEVAKKEIGKASNIFYISDDSFLPIDDFAMMANCSNNIIASSTFSWWAAYLNKKNDKLIIAPYPFRKDELLNSFEDDTARYVWKFLSYGQHLPKKWVNLAYDQKPLSEASRNFLTDMEHKEIFSNYKADEFKIYSGDLAQLELCEKGDFHKGLCFLNKKTERPTVVSAYYSIPSKFSHETYKKWVSNFLTIPFDLVVFTDKENAGWIREVRGNLPLILIEKEFSDLESYKDYNLYKEMYEIDKEKYHSPELYIIWAEKVHFVKEAIKLNPYKANYFVWSDIGIIRELNYKNNNFPSSIHMWNDQMHFGLINDFSTKEIKDKYKSYNMSDDNIQAGIFAGDKYAWAVYDIALKKIKSELLIKKEFLGKEQYLMDILVLQYPWLARLIYREVSYKGNPWWFILLYFSESL